jgi:hypothetical protein
MVMSQTGEILDKFNEMLHDGKYTPGEAYSYLRSEQYRLENEFYEKHGFHMDMSYNFLYPERIDLDYILGKLAEDKNNKEE